MSDDADEAVEAERGEGSVRPHRGDLASLRLYRRALKAGWTVPPELKTLAVDAMAGILKARKSERGTIAATRALVSMTGADLASIDTALRARAQTELEERIAALEDRHESGGPGKGGPPCP